MPSYDASMSVEEYKERAKRFRQDHDRMLQAMCQFLALSEDEKLAFLPPIRKDVTYKINECGDRTNNPLYSYCNAIFELTDRYHGPSEGGFAELIADINSIVAIMIEQRKKYPYVWYIDETKPRVSGPADRVWSVLRRLAEQALAIRQWPKGLPTIPFAVTTWAGTSGRTE
jgi:hypothetical protein